MGSRQTWKSVARKTKKLGNIERGKSYEGLEEEVDEEEE